jgi:HD-GYP domain-containing protein (c-di-GMP phosphodiesterase class II)
LFVVPAWATDRLQAEVAWAELVKVRSALSNDVIVWGLVVLAFLTSVCCVRAWGPGMPLEPAVFVLVALAFVAECLPVDVERRSIHFTFSLPFVASIALLTGPSAALIVAVGSALFACWLLALAGRRRSREEGGAFLLLWNLGTVALSAGAAGVATSACGLLSPTSDGEAALAAFTYTAGYGVVNFLIVTLYDVRLAQRRASDHIFSILQVGSVGFLLYGLVSGAVAILVFERAFWLVPGTAIPLLGLRAALVFKAGAYAHYYETITALTLMMQRAHPYTHGHLQRVANYAEQVAMRLGFGPGHSRLIREASVLHDLGKIAVDERVLDKPGKLTEEEMCHVRLHAELGAAILAPVKPFEAIVPWVRHHHERPDGRGYPDRMLDVEIPMESKIIAVADAFDAMTMDEHNGERRSYRDPMTVEEALEELQRCSGTQFDPRVVAVFKEVVVAEGRA